MGTAPEPASPGTATRHILGDWLQGAGLEAEFRETHASVVALTADRVFKMKKPVRFPFLDLSTPERRLDVCHRELELNRRLAPDVYLGVVDVTDSAGTVIDHAVEMRRLPDEDRLDHLIHTDDGGIDCVLGIAAVMARFHGTAATSDRIAGVGTPRNVRRLWLAELAGLKPFTGTSATEGLVSGLTAGEVERLAGAYIGGRGDLFRARAADGRIRDGHGDLRADDVFCQPDGIRVIDCLEFDDELRWGDVLADIAFLAMDLEWLGRPDLATLLLGEYRRLTDDDWPESLAHHWMGYRAHVRAKVACLRALGGGDTVADARGHLDLALRHLRAAQVRLVLVGGLPGTGKSTLATALADGAGMTLIRSDVVRRESGEPQAPGPAGFGKGRYSTADRAAVYRRMIEQAEGLLRLGRSVILDATWSSQSDRTLATTAARTTSSEFAALRCTAPADVAAERIRARMAAGTDASEADPDVARQLATHADPWPDAIAIDAAGDVSSSLAAALAALGIDDASTS